MRLQLGVRRGAAVSILDTRKTRQLLPLREGVRDWKALHVACSTG